MIAGNFSILIPTLNEEKDILNCLKRVIENVSDLLITKYLLLMVGQLITQLK